MQETLGKIYESGERVIEAGTYQLVGDRGQRVIDVQEGDSLPGHPETGNTVYWRFIRVANNITHDVRKKMS